MNLNEPILTHVQQYLELEDLIGRLTNQLEMFKTTNPVKPSGETIGWEEALNLKERLDRINDKNAEIEKFRQQQEVHALKIKKLIPLKNQYIRLSPATNEEYKIGYFDNSGYREGKGLSDKLIIEKIG